MSETFTSISSALSTLQTDVANQSTVIDGAVTLIRGIPALIQNAVQQALAAGADPTTLTAFGQLADTLEAKSAVLASAVASSPNGSPSPGAGVTNPAPVTPPGSSGVTSSPVSSDVKDPPSTL